MTHALGGGLAQLVRFLEGSLTLHFCCRQEDKSEKVTGSSSTPYIGQALRRRPKKLQSQLKKLASSIVALRESISTQAPERSRITTRIPVPRRAAAVDRPASAQHRGSRCPEGRSTLTAEAPPEGHTVIEETRISDWEDDDKVQECWTEQVCLQLILSDHLPS